MVEVEVRDLDPRPPASTAAACCPCVPPLCPVAAVVELTYRVVCLPEHQCAMHTVPLKNLEPFYCPATKFYPESFVKL